MRRRGSSITLSATDLSGFLSCRHRAGLDLAVAEGALARPEGSDPFTVLLQERGTAHEAQYVEALRAQHLNVVTLTLDDGPERTLEAMRDGADVIVQANLAADGWAAFADVLRRVALPSAFGPWSYEACDTKLARETRAGTILQLSVYSELLERWQEVAPEHFHVVTPGKALASGGSAFVEHAYRVADFAAYYRLVRDQLRHAVASGHESILASHYPEPTDACDVCRWWARCNARRRGDDHLSFVAGAGRMQRAELMTRDVATLAAAATLATPIAFTPARGSRETYARICEQARLQHEQRTLGVPRWELLPLQDETDAAEHGPTGLRRLPAPSPHDVFLDLEGTRFAREGGREYLFGLWTSDGSYRAWWAFDDADEKRAFEAVVDWIDQAWGADDGMHVYHFGHYEPTALKRLMGRHATRADAVDRLLRSGRFVDLHAVVRQSIRAGVESYSIKQLEQYYVFTREVALKSVVPHLLAVERVIESGTASDLPDDVLAAVRDYNRDDCRSTEGLRDWLERLRAQTEALGTPVPRPVLKGGEASENVNQLDREADAIGVQLLSDLPTDASDPSHALHPLWLLAYLVDWHRREEKAEWWDYFRVLDLPDEELLDEKKAIAGLEFVEHVEVVTRKDNGRPTGSVVDRYRHPIQEIEIGRKASLKLRNQARLGTLAARDREARTIDIKKGKDTADLHPPVVFSADVIGTSVQQRSVMRLAADMRDGCGLDLLFRRPPRLRSGTLRPMAGESVADVAMRLAWALDRTTLAIQGPPGAGKTYTGAQMVRALVRQGKRVGVTAGSHKVIRNLLDAVREQAAADGERLRLGHKVGEPDEAAAHVRELVDNDAARQALRDRGLDVLGGTPFLWAREEFADSVDVLFVDEAGQMSLANALAVSQAAESLVLLGDPQQLEQPQKGSHPDGVSVSALEHVLGGAKTMPEDQGLFLPTTWRLAPAICRFTSEVFYEGKLRPKAGLERQRLVDADPFSGAGLWFVPVDHDGNQSWSAEEVEVVDRIVARLLGRGRWIDEQGISTPLRPVHFRVVAPYNAQVNRLSERLSDRGVPVGTVDKFQGQEAPVVLYSMATSRPEDAPRGLEFLYSLNRLNVATSRARCAVIVVASPMLFEPECRTPRQMQLVNALCRYREMAEEVPPSALEVTGGC